MLSFCKVNNFFTDFFIVIYYNKTNIGKNVETLKRVGSKWKVTYQKKEML